MKTNETPKFNPHIYLINKNLASIITRKGIFVKRKNGAKKIKLAIHFIVRMFDLLIC